MDDREPAAGDVIWQPFVDALCSAASTWDADLGRIAGGEEAHVPVSPEQAENVMLALAALAHRMAAATESIVRSIADTGLTSTSDGDDLSNQVELLGRMALCADAMSRAAGAAQAVIGQGGSD
jgi:hypothetical protein